MMKDITMMEFPMEYSLFEAGRRIINWGCVENADTLQGPVYT
jgi:hypothetical protein